MLPRPHINVLTKSEGTTVLEEQLEDRLMLQHLADPAGPGGHIWDPRWHPVQHVLLLRLHFVRYFRFSLRIIRDHFRSEMGKCMTSEHWRPLISHGTQEHC